MSWEGYFLETLIFGRKINSGENKIHCIFQIKIISGRNLSSLLISVFFLRICFVIHRCRPHAKCFMHFPAYECTKRIVWREYRGILPEYRFIVCKRRIFGMRDRLREELKGVKGCKGMSVCKYRQTWYRGHVDTFIRRPKSERLDELLKGFHGSGEMEVLVPDFQMSKQTANPLTDSQFS